MTIIKIREMSKIDSNNISNNAPVRCSKTVLINSNIEKVWSTITNIDNWTTWQKDISSAKLNGELKPTTTFDWKANGLKIHSILHAVVPYKYFGWSGKIFGVFAVHNWTITEKKGQAEVKVEESMQGFLAVFFKKYFNKNLEKGMLVWLDLLKKECEK
jgi:hypothetical protein